MIIRQLESKNFPYTVRLIKTTRITIKVNALGKVTISAPKYCTATEVNKTIDDHMNWITEQRQKLIPPKREFRFGEEYLFLGNPYRITVVQSRYEKVYLENGQMFIYTSSDDSPHKRELVMKWLEEMREITFSEMLRRCFEEVRTYIPTYPTLQIKNYRSRWGCCYAARNTIILNEKLIHLPVDLIRYIIIHELTHLRYPNHGNEFHAFIRMFVPDERRIRSELKKYSVFYE